MSVLHDGHLRHPTLSSVPLVEKGERAVRRSDGCEVTDDTGQVPRVLPGSSRTGPAAMPEGSAHAEVWKLLEDVMEYGAACVDAANASKVGQDWRPHNDRAMSAYSRIIRTAYRLGGTGA